MKKKIVKSPIDCKTFDDICNMPEDNVTCKDFWILTDGLEVTIANQKIGEHPSSKISVPKKVFDKFVKWYMTGRMNGR